MIKEIEGRRVQVLKDRTTATLRRGDIIRVHVGRVGEPIHGYFTIVSEREKIAATRRRRGLPFHRIPSVLVTVTGGVNGTTTPGHIPWTVREGRDTSGQLRSTVGHEGPYLFDTWKFDTDVRWDIYRPVTS